MFEEIKSLLGLSSSDKDGLLTSLISLCIQPVINYISVDGLPAELEYIVIEMVLARYNKLGSEGLKSESVDGVSYSYSENTLTYEHKKDLDLWVYNNSDASTKNRVRARIL